MSAPTTPTATTGSGTIPDPADEAGGEVIYSSDGLAPVAVTAPKATMDAAASGDGPGEEVDLVVLDSEQMPAERAFEVFQGKVYSVTAFAAAAAPPGSSSIVRPENESPLEKLARLQREVSDVEAQLRTTAADSGRAFDEQIVQLAGDLKSRLMMAASAPTADQDELTRMIRKQLEQVHKKSGSLQSTTTAAATSDSLTTTTTSSSTGLVYELYGNATNPTTTMEERVLILERLLGNAQESAIGSGTGGGGTKSLLQRLEEMESLVATVDAATLEQTATKAKVIRADLEAASKARSKLSAAYKKEDTKMIQQLHQQMVDLEGLSDYLPGLVERLSQLSGLHRQASTFGSRLDELEQTAQQMETAVGQLEGGMEQLQSAMVTNIETLELNMAKLDERLSGLK